MLVFTRKVSLHYFVADKHSTPCLSPSSPQPCREWGLYSDFISMAFIYISAFPLLYTRSAHCTVIQCLAQESQGREGPSILTGSSWNMDILLPPTSC